MIDHCRVPIVFLSFRSIRGGSIQTSCRSKALYEIAFAPEMLPHRIEKERKARRLTTGDW